MSRSSSRYLFLALFGVALPLLGCFQLFNTFTIPEPDANLRPLLSVVYEGGFCVYGGCRTEVTLYADGGYHAEDVGGEVRDTYIDAADLEAVVNALNSADFEAMRSKPFTDTCPIAYDGNEIIYTFHTSEGTETLSSCEYVLDERYELIQVVQGLIEQYGLAR